MSLRINVKSATAFQVYATRSCPLILSANYPHLRDNDIFCFSDVTQPVGNIFMQNDSRPCPSLHGHHSTSRTMPQGKIAAKYRQDAQGHCYPVQLPL